jgi:hypothetical protein
MKWSALWNEVHGAVIISMLCSSCASEEGPVTAWDSPRLLSVKREWDSLVNEARKGGGREKWGLKNEKLRRKQDNLLRRNLSIGDMRRLAATCGTLPVHEKDPGSFELNVLQFMVVAFIDGGDRDSLVVLLSTSFQEFVGPETTTAYYLLHCPHKSLSDPVAVLGDAYIRCETPEVRREIAAVVRRGFEGFNISGRDDADFVRNAMTWYERNKNHIIVRQTFGGPNSGSFFEEAKGTDNGPSPTMPRR